MSGGGPVLKPSTLRAWYVLISFLYLALPIPFDPPRKRTVSHRKVTTGVATFFTGFQLLFRTDYGEREHVFTPVRAEGVEKRE